MNTKIVYVLVCGDSDYYLEQTLISACSCRLHNPYSNILVVTEEHTYSTLRGKRSELKKIVSEFIIKEIPAEYNQMQKSRYLKTNLRKFIDGDFLYIDSDTVIADSLEEIDSVKADLAAVYDSNRQSLITDSRCTCDSYINDHTKELGWPSVIGYPNYNGGVLFSRDSEISRMFFSRWFELWKESVEKGKNIDMPALCRSNIELGGCIKELPGIWNCQIQRQGLDIISLAKIIHCFTGGNITQYELCSERVLDKIKFLGALDEEILGLIRNAKTAFAINSTLISSGEAELLKLPINKLYLKNKFFFRVFNKIASILIRL